MRQLFVPACVCLMTWSGPAGPEAKTSLENFTGVAALEKKAHAQAPGPAAVLNAEENAASFQESFDESSAASSDVSLHEKSVILATPPARVVKPVVHRSRQEVCDTLTQAAQSNNLPVPFFIRLLFQESGFKPGVVSHAGAQGVAQFMPATAAGMGLDNPFDPLQAIPASARLLRDLFQQFGNLGLAAAAYNAGPKRIHDWLAKKGKLPEETQGYVKIITGQPAETWKAASARHPEMRIPRRAPCQEAAGMHAWNGPAHIPVPRSSPLTRAGAIAAYEKPARVGAQRAKTIVQLAARKQPTNKATLDRKTGDKAGNKLGKLNPQFAGKPIELASAARSGQK